MNTNEWALVVFTVVMQMAVGAFILLGGVHYLAARRSGAEEADKLSDRALLAIGPVVALGLLVTLFHLGNPMNAPRALTNVGTSWLSREILFALLFAFFGAVFALLQWRKLLTAAVRNGLALVVAALGIALVVSMSMVYRLFSVPAWDNLGTPAAFFLTTVLLGSLAMGAAFVANFWYIRRKQMDPNNVQYTLLATSLRWIALIAIAALGLQFVVTSLYLSALGTHGSTAATDSLAVIGQYGGLIYGLRLALLFVGAGLMAVFLYAIAASESKLRIVSNLAYVAFALVLISETLGRYLFYASMVRIGL
jgi:anaerobic dimethyl sulfoxide reductase subunit C (anchor subunit)